MKTLKCFPTLFCLLISTLASGTAFADGSKGGGGGDACERRIDEIRADILTWINEGGAKSLVLPTTLNLSLYEDRMREILSKNRVLVSCVVPTSNDPSPVKVAGIPKTCVATVAQGKEPAKITCDFERFYQRTAGPDQYSLIHHEFAGLQSLEENIGAASDYELSNQITKFLVWVKTLKLKVRPTGARTVVGELGAGETNFDKFFNPRARAFFFAVLNGDTDLIRTYKSRWDKNNRTFDDPTLRNSIWKHLHNQGTEKLVFKYSGQLAQGSYNVSVSDKDTGNVLFMIHFEEKLFQHRMRPDILPTSIEIFDRGRRIDRTLLE